MIAFVLIDLFRGTPADQHRPGRVHLVEHLPGRPGYPAGLPVREPFVQPHEAVAAGVARSIVCTCDVPVEGHRHVEH
jgi:hypothetical protein